MKDNVLDLLIYLFENYMSADDEPRPDRNTLKIELDKAGFAEPDIERALEWLDGLSGEQLGKVAEATARAVRVFSGQELLRLDTDVRGYLMYLENLRILSGTQRELVIDRLMALEADEIDIEQVKWVVLMVLFSQPGPRIRLRADGRPGLRRAHRRPALDDHLSSNLVIVESPAKAKTIKKYLGKDFEVLASYGHVRDLVPKEGAVDPKRHFAMKYQVVERNQKHVDAIARALKKAKSLYLATDPDREGEAISWHLYELLKAQGALKDKDVQRVVFYEITKNAVREAMAQPRELSVDLVNAQQARRALDFLVGFNLSPLLWKKVRPGLSAGRVQSPALRMICEREDEIAAFVPREYWTIDAELEHSEQRFPGKLVEYLGKKVEQFTFTTADAAHEAERTLQNAARGELTVLSVDRKQRRRNPAPPFTTSTLQQEAARKLGFSAQKTMRVAQQLYEGVDIGEGAVGLITYMRTDSLNLVAGSHRPNSRRDRAAVRKRGTG